MSDSQQKIKVLLTAVYKNGDVLKEESPVPGKIGVYPIPGAGHLHELRIRLVVAARESEELLEGFLQGKASISLEQIIPPAER